MGQAEHWVKITNKRSALGILKGQRIVYIDATAMIKLLKGVTDPKRQEVRVECTTGKVQLKDKRARPAGKKVRSDA